jgi:hypothetical protein
MFNIKPTYIIIAILTIALLFIVKCKEEPEVITNTVTKIVTKTDTITNVKIKEIPTVKYIVKTKTVKGKDSIIYVDKETNETIKANEYKVEVDSNEAKAKLEILTTGQLLDVKGVITYPEKETTIETIKLRNKGGLFLYGETSIEPTLERIELGVDWVIKNKVIIGASASYNDIAKQSYINAKIGIKLF